MFCEEDFLMWLSRIEGVSLKKKFDLLEYFNCAKNIFYADDLLIKKFCVENKINPNNIIDYKQDYLIERYINELKSKNISFISIFHKSYPNLLKNISDPPIGLYVLGEMPKQSFKKVAIVGSRKCTQYGASNAYRFGREMAENNIVVVSGLALGIDSMAHKGAIDGGGLTISVLGCGVDIVYPPSNRHLRDEIIENGCVISEFPPDTPPFPANFPLRNRIISGVSDSIVVVEAAKRSGTFITVGQALEQGRDVFAIPGNINNSMSQGTNELIKNGAFPLTEINDILQSFGNSYQTISTDPLKEDKIIKSLSEEENLIYSLLSSEAISIDELINISNLSIQIVQFNLTMLELKGYIKKLSGQKYIKNI